MGAIRWLPVTVLLVALAAPAIGADRPIIGVSCEFLAPSVLEMHAGQHLDLRLDGRTALDGNCAASSRRNW